MESNGRFDQLEGLMADMLRRMDQLTTSQERTNTILDGIVDVLKISDQRFQKVEETLVRHEEQFQQIGETLLRHDDRFRRTEERQDATLRLLF